MSRWFLFSDRIFYGKHCFTYFPVIWKRRARFDATQRLSLAAGWSYLKLTLLVICIHFGRERWFCPFKEQPALLSMILMIVYIDLLGVAERKMSPSVQKCLQITYKWWKHKCTVKVPYMENPRLSSNWRWALIKGNPLKRISFGIQLTRKLAFFGVGKRFLLIWGYHRFSKAQSRTWTNRPLPRWPLRFIKPMWCRFITHSY